MTGRILTSIMVFLVTELYPAEETGDSLLSVMNGWTIAMSVVVAVVTVWIIAAFLIQVVKAVKSLLKRPEPETIRNQVEKVPVVKAEDIPEEHLILIAAAIEIYKRLYLVNSMSSLTCKPNDNHFWKSMYRFHIR